MVYHFIKYPIFYYTIFVSVLQQFTFSTNKSVQDFSINDGEVTTTVTMPLPDAENGKFCYARLL